MSSDPDSVTVTAEQIAAYLRAHPDAADSIEGISRWWISQQRLEEASSHVRLALEFLVKDKVVATRAMPDGRIVYFLAAQK